MLMDSTSAWRAVEHWGCDAWLGCVVADVPRRLQSVLASPRVARD